MPLSPRTHEAFRLAMILHTLKDAPPELRSALMRDDATDEEVTPHLHSYIGSLKSQLQPSAQSGGQVAPPDAPKTGSKTAGRAVKFLNDAQNAEPASASAPAKSDEEKAAKRRQGVGSYFKK